MVQYRALDPLFISSKLDLTFRVDQVDHRSVWRASYHFDPETDAATVFTIMFEVSSSYGTVGLSLGTPLVSLPATTPRTHIHARASQASTSLSGAFRTLSKLVIIFVMIRGRHRGLPIAIDRAVTLPSEARTPAAPTPVKDEDDEMMDSGVMSPR